MNKLKLFTTVLFVGLMLSVSHQAISQTLYFCEDVDDDGYPENESSSFTISDDGGYLYFLVRLGYKVRSDYVNYDIYKVDSYGEEKFYKTIKQDTEYDWVWFYKKMTFYDSGTFNVYVYDEDDNLLVSGKVKIKYR